MNRDVCLERIQKVKRVVIKVGTSLLMDPSAPEGVNRQMLEKLRDESLYLKQRGIETILVSSGSVGMGREVLRSLNPEAVKERPDVVRRQALASLGQSRLMAAYGEVFSGVQTPVGQILLTARDFSDRRSYLNIGNTIEEILSLGGLPIVNENDTVSTDEIQELRYGDNDVLSAACATLMNADLLVILTSVEGFLMDGKRVEFLSQVGDAELEQAGGPEGPGTGGMATKLQAARLCLMAGEMMGILPGEHPSPLRSLFEGESIGTLVCGPGERKLSARKRWILYARTSGQVQLDAGAVRALVEKGSSLLPAGVTHAKGHFLAGDVVDIFDDKATLLGRGITNYSYREIHPLLGLSGAEITAKGHVLRAAELIHRNNLILER